MKNALLPLCIATLLAASFSSCSLFQDEVPPAAGTLNETDPVAQQIFAKGKSYLANGRDRKARKAFREVIEEHPLSEVAAESHLLLAELYEKHNDPKEAFELYSDLTTKYPTSALSNEAHKRQERLAHAISSGEIKTSFLGLKSNYGADTSAKLLKKVADSTPESESAAIAKFRTGEMYEQRNEIEKASLAYRSVVDDHPYSSVAAEAQFRIGTTLMKQAERGNQDLSTLNAARDAFQDYIQRFPNGKRATEARQLITAAKSMDAKRSYEVAEFYRKKKNYSSAAFYYREVLNSKGDNPYRAKAQDALNRLQNP